MNNKYYRDEVYEKLSKKDKDIIDEVYKVVNNHCKENSIQLNYNDDAELFVGAITEYLLKSGAIKEGTTRIK